MKGKILVIYYNNHNYPLRQNWKDSLYCFSNYAPHLCYYLNVAFGVPDYFKKIYFDLIIFHPFFLYQRSRPKRFRKLMQCCVMLKNLTDCKIAIAQDEHMQTKWLNQFINEFKINHLFSAAPASQWNKFYPDINKKKVKIKTILTGYLDEATVNQIKQITDGTYQRSIDIGYRATQLRYWHGSHGYLKYQIGKIIKKETPRFNLKCDISTSPNDILVGLDWHKFLLKCKYTIGVESGASLMDWDGQIEHCVTKFILQHTQVNFSEVEKACFPGLDGQLQYFTLGPRHLEACLTKTCQILIEGNYNNILKPNKHYLVLKKDFSNLDYILNIVKDDKLRKNITEQAYQDIVASGKYTYRQFVSYILKKCIDKHYRWSKISKQDYSLYQKNQKREKTVWKLIPLTSWIINNVLNHLPRRWLLRIIKYFD